MKSIFVLVLTFLLESCVYKLDKVPTGRGQSYLTVFSEFSDLPGDQTVRLSYSSMKVNGGGQIQYINGATVYITDDKGGRINFEPDATVEGNYVSNTSAQAGNTYTLHILTPDGKKYRSAPEPMPVCPPIDSMYYRMVEDNRFNDNRRYGLNVYLDLTDHAEANQFYQWTWIHYESAQVCAVCYGGGVVNEGTDQCGPSDGSKNTYHFYCDGACWDITRSTSYNLLPDTYYQGKPIKGVLISRVPFYSTPFSYYLQIQQRSLTRHAYLYFSQLKNQLQSNGSLFDVPAQTQFNINIFEESDAREKVLGIFNVFAVRKKLIYLDMTRTYNGIGAVPTPPPPGDVYKVEVFGHLQPKLIPCIPGLNRTNRPPEGWQ